MHRIRFSWSEMKAFTSADPVACKLHLETINGMRWLIERRGYLTLYKVFHFSPQLESRSNELLSFQEMVLTLQKSWYPQSHNNYTLDSQKLRLQTWSIKPGFYNDLLGFYFCFICLFVICFVVVDVVLVGFAFEIAWVSLCSSIYWGLLCRWDWPQVHRNSPASASLVMGWKAHITILK